MKSRSHARHGQAPVWQTLSAFHLVSEAVRIQHRQLSTQGIQVQIDVPRWVTLTADRNALRQALGDLIDSATVAMPDGGELSITVWPVNDGVELEVADSRAQAIHRERAQAACQSLPPSVRRAATMHGGDLTVANCPEGGLAVTMRLPMHAARVAAA